MPDTGFSRSPKLQKGAIVQLTETVGIPVPQIIPFQFNPESLSRSLTPWVPQQVSDTKGQGSQNNTAQPSDPQETISIQELHLDASDQLEDGEPVSQLVGVGERIAAIENLLYPQGNPLALVVDLASQALSAAGVPVPPSRPSIPVTLFVWGVGRIVPVLITEYTIEEQQYLPSLRPLRATLSVTMQVQLPDAYTGLSSPSVAIARAAYTAHRAQQTALAAASTLTHADELRAILPF